MPFVPKATRDKVKSLYKTLYISEELKKKVEAIAEQNDTSFNNVVISMIEHCINEENK